MPTFRFRLRDPKTSEFRLVAVSAQTREEAVAIAMAREQKATAFNLTDEKVAELSLGKATSIADWEKALREGTLSAPDRARLLAHYQEKPYKLVEHEKGD